MRMGWIAVMSVVASSFALALSCAREEEPSGGGTGGSGLGGSGGGTNLGGSGGTLPPPPPASCGEACETDLAAARAALEAADYTRALELYRCANTPEAAFGAGLSRLLTALEGTNADAVLADFGLPHLPASQLLGPNSTIARENARWDGGGALALTGGMTIDLAFQRGQQELEGPTRTFNLMDSETVSRAYFGLELRDGVAPVTAGAVLGLSFDCSAGYTAQSLDERVAWLDLDFEVGGETIDCGIAYSPEGACEPDGGRIVVSDTGVTGGQGVVTFENLLLDCWGGPSSDFQVRMTGSVHGLTVSGPVATADLHPLFQPDFELEPRIPAQSQLTGVITHAAALTAEFEEAACFFRKAGEGTGTVFTSPGALYGGADVPISPGDSQVLAAGLLFLAGAGQLASAYEVPMALKDLICDDGGVCPTDGQLASTFNSAFAQVFHADRFATAKRLLGDSLAVLDQGMGNLDGQSLFVRNENSAEGLDLLREAVQAARGSLGGTPTAIPRVSPAVTVTLGAFFDQPKNPRDTPTPVLAYSEECDDYGCWSETQLDTTFLTQHFAGVTNADFVNGEYEWASEDAVGTALEEVFWNAGSRFLTRP